MSISKSLTSLARLPVDFGETEEKPVQEGVVTLPPESIKKLSPENRRWAPEWDFNTAFKVPPIAPFKHTDRGFFGDPSFDSLFKGTGATSENISPKMGTEVHGIQLSTLTDKQKDDLALLVEQRGVVVFRDQDFKDRSFDELKEWGRHFGPLHVHTSSGCPAGQDKFHVVYDEAPNDPEKVFERHNNFITWHSDVTYDPQPAGITALVMVQTGGGGDTQYVDTIEAYDRLSPTFQKYLDGLQAVHTSKEQVDSAIARGSFSRKKINYTIHPVVRYHPVLRKKALFINGSLNGAKGGFTRKILGLKDEESDALLSFLFQHIDNLLDAHIRASWDDRTVVVWDNRRVIHTATKDFEPGTTRLGFRVTPVAERPVASEKEYEEWTPEKEEELIKHTKEYLALTPREYYEKFYKK